MFKDDDWSRRIYFSRQFNCDPTDIRCNGCQALRVGDWGFGKDPTGAERCNILRCPDSRGYKYCFECLDWGSCNLWGDLNRSYSGMPWHNLKRMREVGIDAWLKEQASLWRCPSCGAPFDIFKATINCRSCGHDLKHKKEEIKEVIANY